MEILVFSAISVSVMAIPNVVVLREILYSIFVGNLGKGKHNRKKADKIHRSHSLRKRVTFSYVIPYLSRYQKDFHSYSKLAIAYFIGCIIAFLFLIVVGFYATPTKYALCWSALAIANCCFFAVVIFVAKVGPDHRTKYDRY